MLISQLQAEGVEECLRRNIPFVLYALPGMVECRFMASLPDSDGQSPVSCDSSGSDCFMISRYASDEPYVSGVTSGMDEGELIVEVESITIILARNTVLEKELRAPHPDQQAAGTEM